MLENPQLAEALNTLNSLIKNGFRFSVIHNPEEKRLQIISATNPDKIKHRFPDFNIYLSNRNEKMVEKVFFYA